MSYHEAGDESLMFSGDVFEERPVISLLISCYSINSLYPYDIFPLVVYVFGYNSYLISCLEKSEDLSGGLLATYYYYYYYYR